MLSDCRDALARTSDRDRGPDNLLEDAKMRDEVFRRSVPKVFCGPTYVAAGGGHAGHGYATVGSRGPPIWFFSGALRPFYFATILEASIAPVQLTDQTTRPTELMTAKVRAALVPASTTPERCHGGPLRWEGSPRVGRRARGRRAEGRAAPARTLTTRPGRAAEGSILESRKPGRQRHRFWRAAPCVNSSAMDYAQAPRG